MNEKVVITHVNFKYQFGRDIGYGTLTTLDGEIIRYDSLVKLVDFIRENELVLINGTELFFKMIDVGYAS